MSDQTKAAVHQVIADIFAEASQSPTPFSTIAHWSVRLQEMGQWSARDIDLVADAVVRLLALQHRTGGKPSNDETSVQ